MAFSERIQLLVDVTGNSKSSLLGTVHHSGTSRARRIVPTTHGERTPTNRTTRGGRRQCP
jgi:hypothetical protein